MTELMDTLHRMGLQAKESIDGRWVKLQGERCAVYVVEAGWSNYYTWCDDPTARSVESYGDAESAIQAGLRRAARRELLPQPGEYGDAALRDSANADGPP